MTSSLHQRVYLIGAGVIAGHHLRSMQQMTEVPAWEWHICDLRPEALAKLQGEFPSLAIHADAGEMLAASPRPDDIVIICTPPAAHAKFAAVALSTGRHVLCEKPLFFQAAEVDEVEDILRAHPSLILGCCSNRFAGTESLRRAREIVVAGQLGRLYRARWIHRANRRRTGIEYQPETKWFLNRRLNGGGVAMDWGPYDLAGIFGILQPEIVTVLSCLMEQVETGVTLPPGTINDVETHVVAQMDCRLPHGEVVRLDYERASAAHGRELFAYEFEGLRAALDLEWIGAVKLRLHKDEAGALVTEEVAVNPETNPRHSRPIREMIKAVHGQPSLTLANENAIFNFRVLRALYQVAETGVPVEVKYAALK